MPLGCRNIDPVYLGAHSINVDEDKNCVPLTVSNNAIVGALLQLSSLVRHADDLFCDISEECQLAYERTDKLCKKLAVLSKTASQLDARRAQVPEGDLKKFSAISEHHRAKHGYDAHLFLQTNRPQCIQDQYNLCLTNPSKVIRGADMYRKDGLSGSKMFKCWPVIYNDQAVRTPDLSLPRRVQRVRSFERKYKKLRERPKTIHGWDDFKLEDVKKEEKEDESLMKTELPVVVSIDTSGSNFERMQSLRLSGRRYQNKEEKEKKKRRRRTVTGVPESIMKEIEKFDKQKRHQEGGTRQTPRSYSFDDLDTEDDLERDEGIVKYLDEIDGKMEERLGEEKAQKLMKFFPCRRSRSLPRCMKIASVTRSLSQDRNRTTRDIDRDLNTTYGSSSLSIASAVSSSSSRLSRATKRSNAIGSKLKSLMSGNSTKDKLQQRPKSLDIDTILDSNTRSNSIKSQERSKSTYSLERNREAKSVPDSLLHKEFSEQSSSTVGPGSYYNFESSTLPRAQQKKYDFPWESLPKDWTTSVKLREMSKRRAKEDRQSSSGNWSQSGTSSNRHSLDSDLRSSEGAKFNSQYSLGKDSGRDSLTLEEENDGGTDTTSTAGYAADGTSTIVGSNDSLSIGSPKSDFTQLETEKWLQSLAARAAKQEGISNDGSLSLSRLTRKNIIALDLMLSQDKTQKRADEESSVYSVDQDGFYTSFHNDSGLRKSTNTLVDEEGGSPTKDTNSVCSVESVIYKPEYTDKYANLRKGNSANQAKVLSKVSPPTPPVRTTSKNQCSVSEANSGHPELHSFPSQDSSVSESDTEAVLLRVHDKTVLSSTGFPSLVALSTSDDESSPDFSTAGFDKKRISRKGDNYIFDETEGELPLSRFNSHSKFSPDCQLGRESVLTSSRSESNFLQYVNQGEDNLTVLHEQDNNQSESKAVNYQSWPRTHKSSTPSGILKTPEKHFDNRPQKTLNFAPMVNLFNPGTQNSVQMPLPSPTNSSSSESNVNTFGVFNGYSSSYAADQKYNLTVPVQEHPNTKLKSKVGCTDQLPLKYQPVITVTPKSRSGDRICSDRERSRRNQMQKSNKSPQYNAPNGHPTAQSTPQPSGPQSNKSASLYAISPVLASRDTKRQVSNTSTNSENSDYMDMQSVGSMHSAESVTSLGSADGSNLVDSSTYMSMSSPCSSPNLSNMDFSMSSTPSGSVDSLLDLRKTPTNELETDTYHINTSLHVNRAYSHQNGQNAGGLNKSFNTLHRHSREVSAYSNSVSSANKPLQSFRPMNPRNTSNSHSLNSSSSDNDLTHVTQISMNSSRGSHSGSPKDNPAQTSQRQSGRQSRQDTRHEPSYRSQHTSHRRSLPSDMSSVNMYTQQKVPLNDTMGKTYASKTSTNMSSSKSYPSGFKNITGSQKVTESVSDSRQRTNHPLTPGTKESVSSRTESYRVAMDVGGNNNRNGSYRVAMHTSKSFPLLPPTTKSGPYRVAMDMSPHASLNNSFNSDNDDVMSRADSYRIAVRNTNGIVPQEVANRNTSYRVAVADETPSMINSKFDAMNMDFNKKPVVGRDLRRMGITDVDQAKGVSVANTIPNGKTLQSQPQKTSRIRKVTKQDVDPIQVVQTVDNNNDTKKSQKNNQNRSSTYIQFDPIFEDDDFGNAADALQMLSMKSDGGDLSFKDYSASLSSASKAKYGMISGSRDANSNDIKSAKRGKPGQINSGIEIEDNWRFSQV